MTAGTLSYVYYAPQAEPFYLSVGVLTRSIDNAAIPCDLTNMDYQAFLDWLAAGNTAPSGWSGPTNTSA